MHKLSKPTPDTKTVSSAASTLVLASNAKRKYAYLGGHATVGLWLNFGAAAVVGTGIYVPAGGAYEIDGDNLYTGDIYAILASGVNQVIGIMELS